MQKTCTFENFPRKNFLHYTKDKILEKLVVFGKISQNFLISRFLVPIKPPQYAGFLRIEKFSFSLQRNKDKTCHHFKNFPLTFLRTLIPKIQPLRIKFLFFFENCFSFHYHKDKKFAKVAVWKKIFPKKQKKTVTADKRADDLSPVLCLTVTVNPVISPYFSTHIRRNSLRPATSAHLIPTVRISYFSVI